MISMAEYPVKKTSCTCGQFNVEVLFEPVRVSVCHCWACQQRTGSCFGIQSRIKDQNIIKVNGNFNTYKRIGDEGNEIIYSFCPICASTLYWKICNSWGEGYTIFALGNFCDNNIGHPTFSVYEDRMHPWISLPADCEHMN